MAASARASEARVSSPPEKVESERSALLGAEAEAAQDGQHLVAPAVAAAGFEPRLGGGVGGHRLLVGAAADISPSSRSSSASVSSMSVRPEKT